MAIELDKTLVARAAELIAQAQRIVIVTHMGPDGDAMGSSLGMYHFLKSTEDRIQITDRISPYSVSETVGTLSAKRSISVIVPNAFPGFLAWMPGAEQVKVYETQTEECKAAVNAADLIICCDFNDPKRIGVVGECMMQNNCPKILIDHHLNPVDFADVTFSFPESPSASEVVYRLLKAISHQQSAISLQTATCIYTGMMTDTGNFSFNSNHPEMYEIIADLVRAGVDKDAVYNAVFNQHSEHRMRLWGYALYRKMRIYPEYHLSVIALSADELERYHHQVGDTEGLVNMPLQISDVYYSVFIREERAKPGTPHSRIRLSFRSQGDRPVNVFASDIFRGGGHMNAAGGELYGTIGQALHLLERHMNRYLLKE